MSCFYCGKRVSLVRKRIDADFCCEEHREKYHARTRRSMEALREVEEHMVVTRRLNEGIPLRSTLPLHGRDLDSLLVKQAGSAIAFEKHAGLPMTRPNLETHVPAATLFGLLGARSNGAVPEPVAEAVRWNLSRVQEQPRPPRAFTVRIELPKAGLRRLRNKPAPCDRPRRPLTGMTVELGSGASAFTRRLRRRPISNSIAAFRPALRPPDPVKPPPPSPPIAVTVCQPSISLHLGHIQSARLATGIPQPELVGVRFLVSTADALPVLAGSLLIAQRHLVIPSVTIEPGAMPRPLDPRVIHRFVPWLEGFRRRQYYSWEPLERFLAIGFATIAGYRPEMRILEEPNPAAPFHLASLWALALQDPYTAIPEGTRPNAPFRERISRPAVLAGRLEAFLCQVPPASVKILHLDARHRLPAVGEWEQVAFSSLAKRQGDPSPPTPARWISTTVDALLIPAWARPHTRAARRTACQCPIAVPQPVAPGPEFAAGRCQAGPLPEIPFDPPLFDPPSTRIRRASVVPRRAPVLPRSSAISYRLLQTGILNQACQAPLGEIPVQGIIHPAHPILLAPALPPGHLQPTAAGPLDAYPPARQTGQSFDIAKGSPQVLGREALERFRRRGYEPMHSGHTLPHWPSYTTPGLAKLSAHPPCPHPSRQPGREPAFPICRDGRPPAAASFRRVCTPADWGLLAPAPPASLQDACAPRLAAVAMPLSLMLPVDSLGPIRDWGLAPPPEPEQPPEPIHEDFAAGLANWICLEPDWKQDIAGVRTGSLALLRPSLNMTDYELEFLGKIEKQSLSWVFRAAGSDTYYAARILLDAAGNAQLLHYSVLAGERDEPVSASLPVPVCKSSSCRIKMCVSGSDFKLLINDKLAGEWNDDRLPEGGVGFFSDGEDRARLYWVKVTPYHDAPPDDMSRPAAPGRSEQYREVRMGV